MAARREQYGIQIVLTAEGYRLVLRRSRRMTGIRTKHAGNDRDRKATLPEADRVFTIHQEASVVFLNGGDRTTKDERPAPELRLPVPHMYSA